MDTSLTELISLSRELGKTEHQLAIFGEGNTSALAADGRFWVKASGAMLSTIDERGFVALDRAATVALLDEELTTDAEIQAAMQSCCTSTSGARPSIEAMMHAFLLGLPGVAFVGHTHPTMVNALLCAQKAEEIVTASYCPDQIVCCGPAPVFVPYTDPGLPLARLVRERVNAWIEKYNCMPKAIMLQNHGLFAIGSTQQQVMSCTLMWAKTAQIIIGAMACGGVNTLTAAQVDRIYTRPDEKYREKIISGQC